MNKEIENINKKVDFLIKKADLLEKEIKKETENRDKLVSKFILENKLLKNSNWEIYPNSHSDVLTYTGDLKDIKIVWDLLEKIGISIFGSIRLREDIELCRDDGELTIVFSDPSKINSFISGLELNISDKSVNQELIHLKNKCIEFEKKLHLFKVFNE